ncbi:MAG: PASTA domain-containing protein [Synergistaceae bacterium]|nr:PASTA domain-containing protein [Synergistaceae bacterium]
MRNFRRWIIIFAFLVIAGCGFVLFRAIFGGGDKVLVPHLDGMQAEEAMDTLHRLGLSAETEETDSDENAGIVISQNIKAGKKVKTGKTVQLKVSRGRAFGAVPDVRFMGKEKACRRLEDSGFKAGRIIQVSEPDKNDGTVLAQNPSAGQKYSAGGSVELLVSTGGQSEDGFTQVPDLRGRTLEEAAELLNKSGLQLGDTVETASSSREGTVVGTRPNIGTRVKSGETVSLLIASAGEHKTEQAESSKVSGNELVKVVKVVEKEPHKEPAENKAAAQQKTAADKTEKQPESVKKTDAKEKKTETNTAVYAAQQKPEKAVQPVATKSSADKAETAETDKTAAMQPKKEEIKSAVDKASSSTPAKTAKVRYVVPPLSSPLSLKITLQDAGGEHVLKDITANGGETVSVSEKYYGEATVSIMLGGEKVWQERYK